MHPQLQPQRSLTVLHRGGLVCLVTALVGLSTSRGLAQTKINYQDHILPLVESHCAQCHNPDKKKGDLDLTSYAGLIKGGGSGGIVQSGAADASKLLKVITHQEEPTMPPKKPRLPEKETELVRKWITEGLLESAGSKAVAVAKPMVDLSLSSSSEGRPTGPVAMPSGLPTKPFVLTERAGPVLSAASSPWAPVVAVTGQKQVFLYQSETLERLGVLPYTNGQPQVVRFSRSGRLLLIAGGQAGKSGRVTLWEVANGKPVTLLGAEFDSVLAADISPDQTRVALGGPSRWLKIHSTSTGDTEQKIKKHTDWITAVAFSPNGQLLASADRNGAIHIWDPENGQEIFALAGHPAAVRSIAWRGDSRILASCSEDGSIKLWEMENGKQAKTWIAHEGGSLGVAYAHDGTLASCGRNGKVRTWDGDGNKRKTMDLTNETPLCVSFSHDGKRLISGTLSGKALIWNASDGKRVGEWEIHPLLGNASAHKLASTGP